MIADVSVTYAAQLDPAVAAKEVWAHLVDDHDATASYGASRAYVAKRKAEQAGSPRPEPTPHPGDGQG
jgi:hypothetical protein